MYILNVTKTVTNENYASELEKYKSDQYQNFKEVPMPSLIVSVLTVEITEEEWVKVKE